MFEKYRVKSNETIDDIARMFHTNKEYIEDLNNLYYSESLREGMDIIVPKNKAKYFPTSSEFLITSESMSLLQELNIKTLLLCT